MIALVLPTPGLLAAQSKSKKKQEKKQDAKTPTGKQPLNEIYKKETLTKTTLKISDEISNVVDKTAEKIDIILAGKQFSKQPNRSRAEIRQLVAWFEGGKLENSTDFGINLRLPNVEKRWQLRFTSYDEEEESRNLEQKRIQSRPRTKEYGASLAWMKQLGKIRTTFQPKLELKDPLDMSYVLRFENAVETDTFRFAPRLDLFADSQKGTGEYVSVDFIFFLTKRLDLGLYSEEEYRERENYFSTSHGASISYGLSDTESVALNYVIGSNNKPHFHHEASTVALSYGNNILPERVAFSFGPLMRFSKAYHFKGEAGLSFSLQLLF